MNVNVSFLSFSVPRQEMQANVCTDVGVCERTKKIQSKKHKEKAKENDKIGTSDSKKCVCYIKSRC